MKRLFGHGEHLGDHELMSHGNSFYRQLLQVPLILRYPALLPDNRTVSIPVSFTGFGVYTDKEKFLKIGFSDIEKNKATYPKESNDGWIGMIQHYFVSAWLPKDGVEREYFTNKVSDTLYTLDPDSIRTPVAGTSRASSSKRSAM